MNKLDDNEVDNRVCVPEDEQYENDDKKYADGTNNNDDDSVMIENNLDDLPSALED